MSKQIFDIKPLKGIDLSLSNEILRKYSKGAYNAKHTTNFDPTRCHLNFEVINGTVVDINKKISLCERMKDTLCLRYIKDPNERLIKAGLKPRYRTVAAIIIGGTADIMRQLAFGKQNIDINVINHPDNSWAVRQKGIEDWAVDVYNFIASKFGKENIIAFVIHLDELNPHVHCMIIPVEDDKQISWKGVLSGRGSKYEAAERFRALHNELAHINEKYGLVRGDDKRESGASHKDYYTYLKGEITLLREENVKLKQEIDSLNKLLNK